MRNISKKTNLFSQCRLIGIFPIVLITLLMVTFNSCRKQSSSSNQNIETFASKEYIQQYIQQHPKGIELAGSNTKLVTTRVDEEGNPLSQTEKIKLFEIGPGCYPTVEPETIIESQSKMRNSCSQNDWQVYASFIISSVNAIVASNPNNTNQKTRGRVIVTNTSTGATVINNNNILPVTISSIGTDPSDPNRTLYRVTFTAESIAFSNSIQNWSLRIGLFFYTECEEESQYPYTVVATNTNLGSLPVCGIVHPMWWSAPIPNVINGFISGVLNCAVCCFSPYPSQQEIEISANASFTDLRHSEVPPGQPAIPNIIGLGDYYQWKPETGETRYIRFRNKVTNGCTGPWSSTKTVIIP